MMAHGLTPSTTRFARSQFNPSPEVRNRKYVSEALTLCAGNAPGIASSFQNVSMYLCQVECRGVLIGPTKKRCTPVVVLLAKLN
jgi:hypothetical protein